MSIHECIILCEYFKVELRIGILGTRMRDVEAFDEGGTEIQRWVGKGEGGGEGEAGKILSLPANLSS